MRLIPHEVSDLTTKSERRDALRAIEQAPLDAGNYVSLGALLFVAFDEPGLTEQTLQRALALDSGNVDARFWLAKLHYHTTQDFETALAVLNDAVEINPDRADCLSLRGAVKSTLDDLVENYIRDYERAVQLEPSWISPRYNLAYALFNLGDVGGAERELRVLESCTPLTTCPTGTVPRYFEGAVTGRQFDPKAHGELIEYLRRKIRRARGRWWHDIVSSAARRMRR